MDSAQAKLINAARTRLWRAKTNQKNSTEVSRLQQELDALKEKHRVDQASGSQLSSLTNEDKDDEAAKPEPGSAQIFMGSYARNLTWDAQTGGANTIVTSCPACPSNFINPFFSNVLEEFSVFVCRQCTRTHFSTCILSSTTNSSPQYRLNVWLSYYQLRRFAVCSVCDSATMDALSSNWHVAHDHARTLGGSNGFDNVLPVCSDCNFAMGTATLHQFRNFLQQRGLVSLRHPVSGEASTAHLLLSHLKKKWS